MNLPSVLRRFLLYSFFWGAACIITEIVCRYVLHLGFPYGYPAVPRWAIFVDLNYWIGDLGPIHSKLFFNPEKRLMYPAPVLLCYKIFFWRIKPAWAALRFLAVLLLTSWIMLAFFVRSLIGRGLSPTSATAFALGTYFLSFPFWYEFHQANMEFVVWLILVLGVACFWVGRGYTAAVLFGAAISMKIFPLVFVGLFLARKQFREAAVCVASAAVITVGSLWIACPDIAYSYQQVHAGLAHFKQMYMLDFRPIESGFDHSLFCLLKKLMPALPGPNELNRILTAYLATLAITGTILFFLRIRKMPLTNQLLCLSIAAVLIPPVSYDYTLLHLYAPFALLVFFVLEHNGHGEPTTAPPGLSAASFLLALVLSAQSEFIYHGVRFAGQIKAVGLVALLIVSLRYPFALASRNECDPPEQLAASIQQVVA